MRQIFLQFFGILGVAAIAALMAKQFSTIPVEKEPICDPAKLKSGEICLATIQEIGISEVIWVDARSQDDWRKNGIRGSYWLSHEKFDVSLAEIAPRLIEGKPVVVYCNAIGCNTSIEIAERIKNYQLAKEVHALHGGWKTLLHAGLVKGNAEP